MTPGCHSLTPRCHQASDRPVSPADRVMSLEVAMPVPTITNGAIIEWQFVGQYVGNKTRTIRHYKVADVGSPINMQGALDALFTKLNTDDDWVDKYRLCCGLNWELLYCQLQVIWPVRYRSQRYIANTGPGTGGENCSSAGIAANIMLHSLNANHHSVGGMHMPCPPDKEYENGSFTGAQKSRYNAVGEVAAEGKAVVAPAFSALPIIFSRGSPAGSEEVFGYQTMDSVRTARRRVLGRGE